MLLHRFIAGLMMAGIAVLATGPTLAETKVLRVVPHADLTQLDPMFASIVITREYGLMIYEELFAWDSKLQAATTRAGSATWTRARPAFSGRSRQRRIGRGQIEQADGRADVAEARAGRAEQREQAADQARRQAQDALQGAEAIAAASGAGNGCGMLCGGGEAAACSTDFRAAALTVRQNGQGLCVGGEAVPMKSRDTSQYAVAFARPLPWLLLLFAAFYAVSLTSFHIAVDGELASLRAGAGKAEFAAVQAGNYPADRGTMSPSGSRRGDGASTSSNVLFLASRWCHSYRWRSSDFSCRWATCCSCGHMAWPSSRPGISRRFRFSWRFLPGSSSPNFRPTSPRPDRCDPQRRGHAGTRCIVRGTKGAALLFVVQVVFTALAMSLYQSFATLIAVGGLGVITSQAILRPAGAGRLVHEVATFAAAVVAGGALYLLAEAVFQHDLRIRPTAYLDNFLSPATFIAHPFGVTALALSEARSVYGGDRDIYGLFAWSFLLIPVPGIVALILTPHLRDRLVTRSMVLALAVAILVLPFAQNLLSGGLMPYRSLIAVPVAVWFLAFAGLEQGGIIVRRVAHTILAFASLQILVIFAQFQAADALAWQHDLRLARGYLYAHH